MYFELTVMIIIRGASNPFHEKTGIIVTSSVAWVTKNGTTVTQSVIHAVTILFIRRVRKHGIDDRQPSRLSITRNTSCLGNQFIT